MGSSGLLKIADGFSMVAEGLRGLASMECVKVVEESAVKEIEDRRERQTDKTGGQKADRLETQEKDTADSKGKKAVAVEDIRAVMAKKSQDGKSKEVRKLLGKYGAAKLSAVKPEDYPELLKEAEVL